MTEQDRALVERVEHDDLAGGVDQALCRIIRELETERDGVVQNLASANRRRNAANDRWRYAGRTIRRLRRRWQWEKREAEDKAFEIELRNIAASQRRDLVRHCRGIIKRLRSERDAARAEVERWSRHAAKRESERDQYVTTALLANQQRDAALAQVAEAKAEGWHECCDAVEATDNAINAEVAQMSPFQLQYDGVPQFSAKRFLQVARSKCPRKEEGK